MLSVLQRRNRTLMVLGAMLCTALVPASATAQDTEAQLYLRPHCEEADQETCPGFDVTDPQTLRTGELTAGDTLDMDLVLVNPKKDPIGGFRVWLSYDAQALDGKTVTIAPAFPTVLPGEADFTPLSGYAKLAANAAEGEEPDEEILPIARIVFTVKEGARGVASPISFYDQRENSSGHTTVSTVASPSQNLLTTELGTLLVTLAPSGDAPAAVITADTEESPDGTDDAAADASSSAAGSATSSSAAPVAPSSGQSSFGLIQVQNVRAGTKENILYVTWDALSHPKLQGYNIYYGTLAGRYLQRRSVSLASRGTVIRDLPNGKTYFVAVRGVDSDNQETAFSSEVSVEIGNPATSSSPVVGSLEVIGEAAPDTIAPVNPVGDTFEPLGDAGIPGKSGSPSGILLLVLGSASIGTLLACRRQAVASRTRPV